MRKTRRLRSQNKTKNAPIFFFDLDGTLCDSLPGVAETICSVGSAYTAELTAEKVRAVIGPPVSVMLEKLLPGIGEATIRDLEGAFRKLYDGGNWRMFNWFPGVVETLARLHKQGCRLFVFTNKPYKAARQMVASGCLEGYFEDVMSRDSRTPPFASKAEILRSLIKQHKVDTTHALVVGDGEEDWQAAQKIGIPFVFARYGYGTGIESNSVCSAQQIHQFHDLIEICNRGF